jgi:hypothetical protein
MTFFHYKKDAWRGGDHTVLLDGTDSYLVGDLELDTYETSDSYGMGSLGYHIRANGVSVFYSNFIPEDKGAFAESLDKLDVPEEGTTIAFIDIPPTNDIFFSRYIIERFKPRSVILYSRQNNQKAVDEHQHTLLQEMPGLHVVRFRDPGDRMHFSGENSTKNQ